MVRVNQFIALAAILALSLFAAQTTFAGPGGSAGDSFTVVGEGLGGLTNLWITDPLGGGGSMNEYEYELFGPQDTDYFFCAQWVAEGLEVPVAVKRLGDSFMWWSKYDGSLTEWRMFGNADTDTPTVMDSNGDGIDEIVVVRDEGPALKWIVRNAVTSTTSEVADAFLFGGASTTPAPGNWDGDVTEGDQPAVTTTGTSGAKLWQWQDGTGEVGVALKGIPVDTNIAYTSNGLTRPGVSQPNAGINWYNVETATGTEVLAVGSTATQPIGNCNL